MLEGKYNAIKNAHARKALQTVPEIMSASLGMGDAETTFGIGGMIKAAPPEQPAKVKPVQDTEDTAYTGNGPAVKPEDFPTLYYMGDDEYGI